MGRGGSGWGRGCQGGCELRIEVFGKIHKKKKIGGGGVGRGGGQVGGGGGSGWWGGQGEKNLGGRGGWGGGVGLGGVRVDVNEELKFL